MSRPDPRRVRFEEVVRRRPVDVVSPSSVLVDRAVHPAERGGEHPTPHPAPCAAVVVDLVGPSGGTVEVALTAPGGTRLAARLDLLHGRVSLVTEVAGDGGGAARTHRSRRHGRLRGQPSALAVTLTGSRVVALVLEQADDASAPTWVGRARYDLRGRLDVHDPGFVASLRSGWRHEGDGASPVGRWRAGGFGQLGLRDLRVVTDAHGDPFRPPADPDGVLLSATSAGPGFFDTAHTSLWRLDRRSLRLAHLSDLFFERPDRPGVFGDHATHVLRDGGRWLVATSTWGDFDPARRGATVAATLAEVPDGDTGTDLLSGRHVLPTRPLPLPVDGLASVGVWDPHLVRRSRADGNGDGGGGGGGGGDDGWLVGYVSARRFFDFHPVVAGGPDLDRLALLGAATDRTATEGTTLVRLDEGWRVLASDGRDNRRGLRERYPVLAVADGGARRPLEEEGTLAAPYPSNIPWPTLVPPAPGDGETGEWLMVGFDARPCGGDLLGYGTHGRVVVMRGRAPGA